MRKFKNVKEIRAAIIGYGPSFGMGGHHFSQMVKAGMVPVAVFDINKSSLENAKKNHPEIDIYDSLDTMLKRKDIDLVVIITPHNTHCELAIKCLNAGKSVVTEKPMAITTAECNRMVTLAKRKKLLLTVYHSRHWDGLIKTAVEMIKKEKCIGDIIRIEGHLGGYGCPGDWWRSSRKISGGILYDWGAHILEYSMQLIDSEITEVTGFNYSGFWSKKCKWEDDTNEDDATIIARFKTGQWLMMNCSSTDAYPKNADRGILEVTGTCGTFIADFSGWKVIKHESGKKIITSGQNLNDSWIDFYYNIAGHMMKGEPLVITAELGRRIIHILDLAGQSANKGATLKTVYK